MIYVIVYSIGQKKNCWSQPDTDFCREATVQLQSCRGTSDLNNGLPAWLVCFRFRLWTTCCCSAKLFPAWAEIMRRRTPVAQDAEVYISDRDILVCTEDLSVLFSYVSFFALFSYSQGAAKIWRVLLANLSVCNQRPYIHCKVFGAMLCSRSVGLSLEKCDLDGFNLWTINKAHRLWLVALHQENDIAGSSITSRKKKLNRDADSITLYLVLLKNQEFCLAFVRVHTYDLI